MGQKNLSQLEMEKWSRYSSKSTSSYSKRDASTLDDYSLESESASSSKRSLRAKESTTEVDGDAGSPGFPSNSYEITDTDSVIDTDSVANTADTDGETFV